MKILFVGDIVGKIGRRMLKTYLPNYVKKYGVDFVIANGENATHGKGLIEHHYHEIIDSGVDVITLGNHYQSKNEIRKYIDRVDNLIRPLNLINDFPGVGTAVYDVDGVSIRVTNILGSAFMEENVNNPYYEVLNLLADEDPTNIHIIDFHAEANGEKLCFAFALDGKVSAILGTHTHIQTKDAKVLENGTGYISDVGMTGYADGSLGLDKVSAVKKYIYNSERKIDPPEEGRGIFSAVVLDIDENTGKTRSIFPIYFIEE